MKTRFLRAAMCACLSLMLALGAGAALAEAKPLPSEIPQWDPANYYACPVEGYYGADIAVAEGETRPFNLYYPKGFEANSPIVYLTAPAGADAEAFIETSGWKQVADENLVLLAILSAEGGAWGDYEAEAAYIDAVYGFVSAKPYIPVRKHNVYMAAYDGAALGQQYAAERPNYFAGILSVGSDGMSEELVQTLSQTESSFYNNQNERTPLGEIIFPVWIVAESETEGVGRMVDYFKKADRTVDEAVASELAENTVYYAPDASQFDFEKEPEFEAVAGVYLTTAAAGDVENYAFANAVWKNMFEAMRRYPTFGEIRSYMGLNTEGSGYTRYDAMVYGGDYVDGHTTKPGQTYSRFWYTYVPSNIDELESVPVVYVIHGSGGGPNEIGEQTGWRLFAEENGIILILPQGSASWGTEMKSKNGVDYFTVGNSWNTSASATAPNDMLFFDYMYDWMTGEFEYADKIDLSRVYASGQSMGGGCSYSLIAYRPYYFAAIAPCSMIRVPGDDAYTACDIPVVSCMGQKDGTISGGFSLAEGMANGKGAFDYFTERYGLTEKGGLNRRWEDFTFLVNDAVCTEESGSLNLYIFETEKGVPMFTAVEGQGMGHATSCEQVEYIWQVFEHFTRDPETQVVYYDGEAVDTAVNLEKLNP
ncbi:MAG: hypothetical protein Q4G52_03815 [Clostridia bacterium]|nr:hypothetical protein [Clostridia bacterium]